MEVRSENDELDDLMDKMRDWVSDGVLLGLLLDPQSIRPTSFAPGRTQPVVISDVLADQPILPGFVLDLRILWKGYDNLFVEPLPQSPE